MPSEQSLTPDERSLLDMVRKMLDETEFAVPVDPSLSLARQEGYGGSGTSGIGGEEGDGAAKLRQLAGAVLRLWAETFKGSHIFNIVRVIGVGLEGFAEILEKESRDRTPVVRIAGTGMV